MFELNPFFHAHLKNLILAFGDTFSGITIQKNEDCATKLQTYQVPIEYAPKNKWISRRNEQPDFMAQQVQITLPRMSFEIVSMKYAPERRIGVPGTYVVGNINGKRGKIFNPVPYDVSINLYALTKDQTDSHQILEQILPFFQPYMMLNYEILPEYQIRKDVPVTYEGYTQEDSYEGSPEDMRLITQTFTFNAKIDLFGPLIAGGNVIKDVLIDLGYNSTNPATRQYEAVVNPRAANKDETHTVDEAWRNI